MKRNYELALLILYSMFIFSLSSIRGSEIPRQVSSYSLLFHFFLYFFYGFVLFMFFLDWKKCAFTGIIYALSDEIHQYFVPGRSCDAIDFLVDSLAIMVSLLTILRWKFLYEFLSN